MCHKYYFTFFKTVFKAFQSKKFFLTARYAPKDTFLLVHFAVQSKLSLKFVIKKEKNVTQREVGGVKKCQKVSRISWMTPKFQFTSFQSLCLRERHSVFVYSCMCVWDIVACTECARVCGLHSYCKL